MDKTMDKKFKDEKLRQRVREESEELRQLKSALLRGYINREREKQILEKQTRALEERIEEIQTFVIHEKEKKEHQEVEEEAEKAKLTTTIRYHRELKSQVLAQRESEERAYHDYIQEKILCDKMIKQINEEDRLAKEVEIEKKQEQRQFIEKFKQEQLACKAHEKKRLQDEADRIIQYKKDKDAQNHALQNKKDEKSAAQERVTEILGNKLNQIKKERDDFEQLACKLSMHEQEERAIQAEQASEEKKTRDRVELRRVHALQIQLKNERQSAEREQDEDYRQTMMAKFAEDDRLELLNAQRRRMKQLEHKRAVEELIKLRREEQDRAQEACDAERDREVKETRLRQEIIEEERQIMLATHANQLLGYLPKGVIRDQKDLDRLGEQYTEAYKRTTQDEFEKHFEQ